MDDEVEPGHDDDAALAQVDRIVAQHRAQRLHRRGRMECALAAEHLVEDAAEGEDVGARVDLLAAQLLRRDVADRAHDHAGPRRADERRRLVVEAEDVSRGVHLRQAEVEDLHAPRAGEVDVLRLEVAVDDAAVVRSGHAVGDLRGETDGLPLRQRTGVAQTLAQRLAFEELEDDVERLAVRAEVVDGYEVRRVEQAEGAGLLLEARHDLLRAAPGDGREELDGHVAGQLRVAGAIDLSHASRADERDDLVAADLVAWLQVHEALREL